MSIPLERLYPYIEHIAQQIYNGSVVIYRFHPHGSKNIENLETLGPADWYTKVISPHICCHDQEPLDYDFYQNKTITDDSEWGKLKEKVLRIAPLCNIVPRAMGAVDKCILLHSEKRSENLWKYLQTPNMEETKEIIPVYYWSHAVIARDWFRYAQHENFKKEVKKQFLIYNRAWSGTREYRLRFADLLIKHDLVDQCLTFCNATDDGRHYKEHTFQSAVWRPRNELEHHFQPSTADPCASADFDTQHYQSTEIEVVLETLYDDDRLHLTEKSLRPIACAHPFILAATHGSLQYVKDYGFKTFDSVWDETYDTIADSYDRMSAIITVMKTICAWTPEEHKEKTKRMKEIVSYNQNYFFSKKFFKLIINELETNLRCAIDEIKSSPLSDSWVKRWESWLQNDEVKDFLKKNKNEQYPTQDRVQEAIISVRKQYSKTVETKK